MEGILRIGVFYDGSHFTYAQNHFYGQKLGWLTFQPFHRLLEDYTRRHYQGFLDYKVVHSAWYQGLFTSAKADEKKLRLDRNRHHDLMHAGIETKFYPMSQSMGEKGIDVAMAIDILQIGMEGIIDVAVLVTGDGDFVPLARALMKKGMTVIVAYFEYQENDRKSFANERLKEACNYALNINGLEKDKEYKNQFKSLFKDLKASE
ncbi:MAG TPA: NYN domain-containing protein [Chitinophagaceae bacterium]|nr:NYN domain-containing protein [Chitinophagaceae bacterium]